MTDSSSSVFPPEPWFASDMVGETGVEPNSIWIGGSTVGYVAQITREGGLTDEDWRRAALLSAAPDLRAALDYLLRVTIDEPLSRGCSLSPDESLARELALAAFEKAAGGDL